jgi:hypothetical protein
MSRGALNRPFKYGADDRREFIVQDSEVALAVINDTSGNPVFLGRGKVGIGLEESKWQIRKITWDSSSSPTRVEWAQNSEGNASADYEFVWTADTDLTITGITQANPAVVTVSSIGDLVNGDQIVIQDVTGMTEVNFDGSNIYTVAGIAGATFQLQGIDSTAFTAYSAGGTVNFGAVVNHTYS